MSVPRLSVTGLSTACGDGKQWLPLVRGVDFDIAPGETLALVGESGSGKSVTSLTLMGLLARNTRWQVQGQALFTDESGVRHDLLALTEAQRRKLRGNQVAMIFQEPMTSLNPVLSVGEQIAESARLHLDMDRSTAMAHARRMLDQVEIPDSGRRVKDFPHQFSGGMRQRVMIAIAMTCSPKLLIADEPTTALDVTIQAQVLALMSRLARDNNMSMLFITHNLGVVAHHAQRVAVMYGGRIVETAPVAELFANPSHPYTHGLLKCLPGRMRQQMKAGVTRPVLTAIAGQAPSPRAWPAGCSFAPRCDQRLAVCDTQEPATTAVGPHHFLRCWAAQQPDAPQRVPAPPLGELA